MSLEILKSEIVSYKDFVMPEKLYKYRDWSNNFHKKLITEKEIFFAPPSSFEDEFDCKIPTRWDLLTDEEILNKYFQDSRSLYPKLTTEQRMEFAIEWANKSLIRDKEHIANQEKETFTQFNDRAGVLSLTEHPAELSMWEKYSISHTGFCVGFDAKSMLEGTGTGGGIVLYDEELQIIHPTPKHSFTEQSLIQIFTKLKIWEFEKEYRTFIFRDHVLTNKERTIAIPSTAFKEIILGAMMKKEEEEALIKAIPEELKHVKIRKAYLENDLVIIRDF